MANHKITELTQDTVPTRTDLLYKIDAAGTADRSVSFADLLKLVQAADVSGLGSFALISSLAHSATTGIGNDDHHAKNHAHNGADGSGTVAYSSVSGTPTIPSAATTVTDETSFGVAKVVGTAATFAREDHTHGSPANPVGFGDVRTISVDTTLAADNSWTPVDYFEVASNVALEMASGAVVEVLT